MCGQLSCMKTISDGSEGLLWGGHGVKWDEIVGGARFVFRRLRQSAEKLCYNRILCGEYHWHRRCGGKATGVCCGWRVVENCRAEERLWRAKPTSEPARRLGTRG